MPASAIVPPSSQTAADTATIAQSPARRSTFSWALPPPGRSGRRISVSISPSPTAVMYGPTWKSSIATTRSPPAPRITTLRLQRRADGREVLGRVGLAERAADRAAVAHDRVGDHVLGVAEEREVLGEQLGLQQLDVAGHRPDPDLAVLLADVGELVEVVDVDQVLGVREPQLHHRQQAVPARDDRAPPGRAARATRSRRRRWSRARTRMAPGSATGLLVGRSATGSRCPGSALARRPDVVALLVLHGRVGADDRRPRQRLGPRLADLGVEQSAPRRLPRSTSRSAGPAGFAAAIGASRPSRASVSVPSRVDLADAAP